MQSGFIVSCVILICTFSNEIKEKLEMCNREKHKIRKLICRNEVGFVSESLVAL